MKDLFFSRYSIPFFLGVVLYLLFKLSSLSIRLSDSNIYFVTASHLARGELLYRDIFFTNFPLLPYFSTIYFFLLGGNLEMYFYTPAIEASLVAVIIFYLVLNKTRDHLVATLSSFVYLYSVIVLITTDHQSGVFLASLFAVISYIFFTSKKYFFVGLFCAAMLLVKAYFLPVALTYGVYFLLKKDLKSLVFYCLGGAALGAVALIPFIIFARDSFFEQVFGYSLTRGAGVPKAEVARFFAFRDLLIFAVLIFNLACIKTRPFWGIFSIFSLLFFLLYQDTYYLYLNFTVPFAALSFVYLYNATRKKLSAQLMVLPTFLGLFFLWNVFIASSQFASLGRVDSIDLIVDAVRRENPEFVYGNNDIAPAVSYLSGVPQLGGIVDTNTNMFRNGVLDATVMTEKILQNNTILVLHSAYYPGMGIVNDTYSEILLSEKIAKECEVLQRFPIHAEGVTNAIAILKCW